MTDKLEPGWYWVRAAGDPRGGRWEVGFYGPDDVWRPVGGRHGSPPAIIGPRLTPPEE
jgi:hypothetical protein